MRTLLPLLSGLLLLSADPVSPALQDPPSSDEEEILALIASERAEADLFRRRGELVAARRALATLLRDDPADAASRILLARVRFEEGRHGKGIEEAERALTDARTAGERALVASCARHLASMLLVLGEVPRALEVLEPLPAEEPFLDPQGDARDAWILGRALVAGGDREGGHRIFALALATRRDVPWTVMLAKGRCEWALGRLQDASRSFVLADRIAGAADGPEPDVLATLAALYFESEREVEARGKRSAGALYHEALELHPTHEAATLGLFELHRYNRLRVSRTPEEILYGFLSARPDSIEGLLARISADLTDGRLRAARETLAHLKTLAPKRRELRTLEAALAWVEHRRDDCEALLAELAANAAFDSRPEREVGRHLLELYRFAEAVPFLERATERDPTDWEAWTLLGRGLANVGREEDARQALVTAEKAAAGRQDAWRNNLDLVLRRMSREQVREEFGELSFSWTPEAADVLRTYLVPFYRQAREELSARYGYTPGPTTIEIFRRHEDFSVRSVGFQGFPALGVCFGPVVTAVSPLAELRGSFSWARTGFHEFSHVVHLGLSHNRCPRWITEGLATWEEVHRNPTWTRNMRRELIDARANGELIRVRELNRVFRGPRILFGYYQGGLLCRMLIDRHGFAPMIHLLEAFDRGLDLDQALGEVFQRTPEELDAAFALWVDDFLEGLDVEPRWSARTVTRLRLKLRPEVPEEEEARAEWVQDWLTIAWGSWQAGRRLDAEEALRIAARAGEETPRAWFLLGEMELHAGRTDRARAHWERAIEAGGRDYRAIFGLASLQESSGQLEAAERNYLLAESVFPGYDHPQFSAERRLWNLYASSGREEAEMAVRERWLAWNAGDYHGRVTVAAWHAAQGRHARAAELYEEANQVDPFRRDLHHAWAESLIELGRWEEAARELEVTALVPVEFDLDHAIPPDADAPDGDAVVAEPLSDLEHAALLRLRARCVRELGREEEARGLDREAEELEDR